MKLSRYLLIPITLTVGGLAFQSCTSTTTPPPTTTQTFTTVTYDSGSAKTYEQFKLDTANGPAGSPGLGNPIPSTRDTITSTIVSKSFTYQGKSNVIMSINTHSANTTKDTIYEYQDSGKLYRYNYGAETLSNNVAVANFLGSGLRLGWVEQSELDGKANDNWSLHTMIGPIAALGGASFPVDILSSQYPDTVMTVAGAQVTAKHSHHLIYINGTASPLAQGSADSYVDVKQGTVLNVVHPGTASLGATIQSPGLITTLVKK